MRLVEKFISINGEGKRAGELAVFLRFAGCDLDCSFCDTRWANAPDCPFEEVSPEELAAYVADTGVRNVTLTGGEPLLQEEMPELIEALLALPGIYIEIETNGSMPLRQLSEGRVYSFKAGRLSFTMDYKLPGSGCESAMLTENFAVLDRGDTVKFVCGSREDLERALSVIREYDLISRCKVYFSPVFGRIEPKEIVQFMIDEKLNGVRLQLQLHKVIWDPDKRGV